MGREFALDLAQKTPYYSFLGFKILEVGEGFCKMLLPYRKEVTHPYAFVHGGAIASLLDSVGVMATLTLVDQSRRVSTCEIKVNFIKPSDSDIIAEGKVLHFGKRTSVVEAAAYMRDGALVAKSLSTVVIY